MTKPVIYYPSWAWYVRDVPRMAGAPAWYWYLRKGLEQVGSVGTSQRMDSLSASGEREQWTTLQICWPDRSEEVVYDWCDFNACNAEEIRHGTRRYFKIQCHMDLKRAEPIGQTVSQLRILDWLPWLRIATGDKTLDVYSLGRCTNWAMRCLAVDYLKAGQGKRRQLVGVAPHPRRDPVPKHLESPLLSLENNMLATAHAKIVVALPGVGGDWTWRHTETLAVGTCLVCPEGPYLMPGNSAGAWVTCKRDLSDLNDVVDDLLGNPARLEATAARGLAYFERELTPLAMAQRVCGISGCEWEDQK